MKALVLSGGGARGAYQAGVLNATSEIASRLGLKRPFDIYTGASAGAINASFLASQADNFLQATENLANLWGTLTPDQVFRSDPLSLGKIGVKWVRDLPLGGLTGFSPGPSLLDTAPLRELLQNNLDFAKINSHIQSGVLKALAVTAVDYHSSMAATFIQGDENLKMWIRSRRFSERAVIHTEHIMASAAIPLLFPPIEIDQRHYGDGCLRNQAPLSPAIHLGAKKILVVGVRRHTDINAPKKMPPPHPPSLARVINTLLNAVLLDGIELDVDRLKKINEFMSKIPDKLHDNLNFRKVDFVWIHPSIDIGQLAYDHAHKLPRFIRYLLRGLGPSEDSKEMISYLLFDPVFCQKLMDAGYSDAMAKKEEIEKLLTEDSE
jgi:NTE family protein